MITSHFLLLLVGIFLLGVLLAIAVSLISNKKRKNIPKSFFDTQTYRKFTDQGDVSIDEVVEDFKLLDD